MTFNSIPFFIFLFSLFLFSILVPLRYRWILSLAASGLFYTLLDPRYLVLLASSIILDYYIALFIASSEKEKTKRFALLFSISVSLFLLIGFKYMNMFSGLLISTLNILDIRIVVPSLHIIIPVGISFFTFKKISYVIDVYRGTVRPEKHIGIFALYVSHFLEILSGPIDRAGKLIPQLKQPRALNEADLYAGTLLILWGLFMKVVVADRLAIYTDAVFNNLPHHYGPSLLIAAYFYTFQIYCDFAGYTNIAIGGGRLLGIDLMPNFNKPYLSRNISDFWRRWHISLSFWFRDYLYIPLGGNRVSKIRRCFNYLVVFALCGLWHGANWTFVVWGSLHGIFLSIGYLAKNVIDKALGHIPRKFNMPDIIRIVTTFHLIAFAWIFFRVSSLDDAWIFFNHIRKGWPVPFLDLNSMVYGIMGVIVVACVEIIQFRQEDSMDRFTGMPVALKWTCFFILIYSVVLLGVDGDSAFIYFQF